MSKSKLFDPSKFYIVRAERAGVFMAKISFIDGGTIGLNATRRLYYWNGALDVTQLAAEGVSKPNACDAGKKLWINERGIDLKSELTVDEFINLTQNSYGGEIIKQLKP